MRVRPPFCAPIVRRGRRLLTGEIATRKMMLRKQLRRVSEWLAATLEMWCPSNGVAGSSPVPSATKPLVESTQVAYSIALISCECVPITSFFSA